MSQFSAGHMWRIAIAFLLGLGCGFVVFRHGQSPNDTTQRNIPSVGEERKSQVTDQIAPTPAPNEPLAPAPQPQAAVVLQPVKIKIPYGDTIIPAGTTLPVAWQDATRVGVKYLDQVQTIPLSGVRFVAVAVASRPPGVGVSAKQENKLEQPKINEAATAPTFNVSNLSLEAHERATADGTQTRWMTSYGSYHRDYRRQKKIIVVVHDLSRHAPLVTAHVYFVARGVNDGQRFIYYAKQLAIDLHGQLEATAETDMPALSASETYYRPLNARYVSEADIDGWIVVAEANGQRFGVKASGPALLDVGQHQDLLDQMAAESGIHTGSK